MRRAIRASDGLEKGSAAVLPPVSSSTPKRMEGASMSDLQAWGAGLAFALLLMIAEQVGVSRSDLRWLGVFFVGGLIGIWLHS
jgi:hypothetical protein